MTHYSDPSDLASSIEEQQRAAALAAARGRSIPAEAPDEDDQGNRYCLDCGEAIPPARIAAVGAVRCVDCASALEYRQRFAKFTGKGGLSTYSRPEADSGNEPTREISSLDQDD
jgi:DnaK suppressor protein